MLHVVASKRKVERNGSKWNIEGGNIIIIISDVFVTQPISEVKVLLLYIKSQEQIYV